MSTKLSLIAGWIIAHRSQMQIAIITIVFALVLAGLLAPQIHPFAGDMPGGGG